MGKIAPARIREIVKLHSEARAFAQASKQAANEALKAAWSCGKLLNETKDKIPHGSWERWCQNCLPELSKVTIWRYRKLASSFEELPGMDEADNVLELYLRLGINTRPANVSAQKHLEDAKLKPAGGVLAAVNSIVRWLNEEDSKSPLDARDDKELSRLKRDFKPVYEKLRQLFEGPRGKESFSTDLS